MESRAALSLQQPAERASTPSRAPRRRLFPFVLGCEVAYGDLVRDVVTGGGRLLVVQTDNATFGRSGETATAPDGETATAPDGEIVDDAGVVPRATARRRRVA